MTAEATTEPRSDLNLLTASMIAEALGLARTDGSFKQRTRRWMSDHTGLLLLRFDEYFQRVNFDSRYGPRRAEADSMGIYLAGLVTRKAVEQGVVPLDRVQEYHRFHLLDTVLVPSTTTQPDQLNQLFGPEVGQAIGEVRNTHSRTACAFGLRISFSQLPKPGEIDVPAPTATV